MEKAGYNRHIIPENELTYLERIGSMEGRNTVWKAMWTTEGVKQRMVAAKSCNNFKEEEVEILAEVQHKNVVKFFGLVKLRIPPDGFVIVTELAEKGSLRRVIAENRGNWEEYRQPVWLKWAKEGAEALRYIHQKNFQHGDVKSPNFVITGDDILKICDLGTARIFTYTASTNTLRGSFPWMAPEAMGVIDQEVNADGQKRKACKATAKSDVFSYAVVIWELITGKFPHEEKSRQLEIYKTVVENKRLEIPRGCPYSLADLMARCWDADYHQRPNMKEVHQFLVEFDETDAKHFVGTAHQDGDAHHGGARKRMKLSEEDQNSTRGDADTTSVPPGDRVVIVEIDLYLSRRNGKMRRWYLKVWRSILLKGAPQLAQNGSYFFNGKLRDESGVPIYFIYFERTLQRCLDRFMMIEESTEEKPLYMWNTRVEEQDEGRGGPERGESEYKLTFDEHSKIGWA